MIDKLISANIKLTIFDHYKKFELAKDNPDLKKIAEWEAGARSSNEMRARVRNAIDEKLSQIIDSGEYKFIKEYRTF